MYEIILKYKIEDVDSAIEKLQLADVYNVFYETPIAITTTEYGYGYYEKKDEIVDLKIIVESDEEEELNRHVDIIKEYLMVDPIEVKKLDNIKFETSFDPIDLNNGWLIADPSYNEEGKNKINFVSQGAFGTGLHETTQDCLRLILNEDFKNKNVLDIGTGSGILSIAAAIKSSEKVTALDLRDVHEEVEFNASLNELTNIRVAVGDALTGEVQFDELYDYIFINIGGEETLSFMDFINSHIKEDGMLLVSGLVEWSFENVLDKITKYGYKLKEKKQTNEWCSALLSKL
ncbi:50S ribosomal protein L11 methyltransferase [Clostridium magnum]|uniref:Ribosomal protein L11 methyltransferase n=1 Tax=Clostridium magnum DSM 2767 TaxID=1121326 RepID=A0A162R4W6_9CLOT|nr:50S ribosomal protein L11 methyltransferase [Clostridium magnum]KZL89427.1 ribosomal protein L11 methyltransferase [Clostridium magnum DSM 2767]SHI20422.1 [LSU ribosomal protein L11P]-lysine N-methyltransferase [Clostridium magnum DSM 2767]